MEQDKSFFLFCCAEQYSINFPDDSLSADNNYFVRYTYPDKSTKDSPAQLANPSVLLSQSPEYDHPCAVDVSLHVSTSEEVTEDITEFSLDLVSPVEYLFRKFSAKEFEMSDKISNKMTSALLAMSLSYYYVMGEHVEKEARTDEILSTLLNCSKGKTHTSVEPTKDTSSDITKFAQQYNLQNTLQYLSGGVTVGDLPVQLPKVFQFSNGEVPIKEESVLSQTSSDSLPTTQNIHNTPNNKPLLQSPSANQDTDVPPLRPPKPVVFNNKPASEQDFECDYVITEPPPRPPKPPKPNVPSWKLLPESSVPVSVSPVPEQDDYEIVEFLPVFLKSDLTSPSNEKVPMRKPSILSPMKSNSGATNKNLCNIPNSRPLSECSAITYDQEGYVETDPPLKPPDKHSFDDSSIEEYVIADETDSSKGRYVDDPVKSSKSFSSFPVSGQSSNASKSPVQLPRVKSVAVTGTMIIGGEYEMCDPTTPVEKAAEEAVKKERAPPPKIPLPYLKSHSIDRSNMSPRRNYSCSDLESSSGSLLQESSSPEPLKPPPRRKFSIHKSKTIKKQPT